MSQFQQIQSIGKTCGRIKRAISGKKKKIQRKPNKGKAVKLNLCGSVKILQIFCSTPAITNYYYRIFQKAQTNTIL